MTPQKNTTLTFLFQMIRPYRFLIWGMGCVSLVYALEMAVRAYLIKVIINRIQVADPMSAMDALLGPVSLYIVIGMLLVVMFRIYDYIWLKLNPYLKRHLGLSLMERMTKHSHTLYQENFAGNLGNKIKDVMSGVPDIIRMITQNFLSHVFSILCGVATLTLINKDLAIALFVWSLFFVAVTFYYARQAQTVCDASAEARSITVGNIIDTLGNMMSVRLFDTAKGEAAHLKQSLNTYVASDQRRDWFFMKVFTVQGLSFVTYQALCFWVLIKGYEANAITAGDFALVLTVNIALIDRLWSLFSDLGKFTVLIGDVRQGLRIVLSPIEIQDKEGAVPLILRKGEITFDHVNFQYKDAKTLFSDIAVTVPAGQKLGLVGYSGSGKTTFVHLILRLYDVTGGRILIDDQDIRDVTQESLHSVISMVPQDPSLFHRSLMENIRYSHVNAPNEAVFDAARHAHAHPFIMELPHGYDSLVGERGVKLSGGQRQRIAIARAFLKNTPILILDEATSQLDSVTEAVIQESLWELMEDKTTIVIAHRLSTLLHLDRILVFDEGRIVEDGTHAELLARGGMYKALWDAQVGGFLPEERI